MLVNEFYIVRQLTSVCTSKKVLFRHLINWLQEFCLFKVDCGTIEGVTSWRYILHIHHRSPLSSLPTETEDKLVCLPDILYTVDEVWNMLQDLNISKQIVLMLFQLTCWNPLYTTSVASSVTVLINQFQNNSLVFYVINILGARVNTK